MFKLKFNQPKKKKITKSINDLSLNYNSVSFAVILFFYIFSFAQYRIDEITFLNFIFEMPQG